MYSDSQRTHNLSTMPNLDENKLVDVQNHEIIGIDASNNSLHVGMVNN